MSTKIQSKFLKILVNNLGAEICSVKNNFGLEYIWQGTKNVWARHAPVLFPIVGKLKENKYVFNHKEYSLSQHGFARDLEFKLSSQSETTCSFKLTSTNETRLNFPFDFVFDINYELNNSTLITTYTIKNTSASKLFFSVGAHPGFNCPLLAEENFEDYYLEFEKTNFSLSGLKDGLRSGEKIKLSLTENKLPLTSSLFEKDALVFENNQINKVSFCSNKSSHKIILESQGWPYYGIWAKKDNPQFICLEPWFGIADADNTNQLIENKDGILALNSDEEFKCSFTMSFL